MLASPAHAHLAVVELHTAGDHAGTGDPSRIVVTVQLEPSHAASPMVDLIVMDDTYATAIPPGCMCKWELQGAGLTGDSPPIPWGAVATWFVLLVRHPKCRYHGGEEERR